jgi:hypothetical protein
MYDERNPPQHRLKKCKNAVAEKRNKIPRRLPNLMASAQSISHPKDCFLKSPPKDAKNARSGALLLTEEPFYGISRCEH